MINEIPRPDQELRQIREPDSVLNRLRLLNGQPAKDYIIDHIQTFPTKTVVVFGEPGVGKTSIASGIGASIKEQGIDVQMTTYDSVSARIVRELGREKPEWSNSDYDYLSEKLLEEHLRRKAQSSASRSIQILELVGIGIRNRGISTLLHLMEQAKAENETESSFLFIGVVPDLRIQDEAAGERKMVSTLPPEEVISFLAGRNVEIEEVDSDLTPEQQGKLIKGFYSSMAKGFQIRMVRQEVEKQAQDYLARDNHGVFELINPQEALYKKRSSKRAENYRLKATFLELFLEEQGLLGRSPLQSLEPGIWDKGVVVYNHYDPNVPRRIDLSLYRYDAQELSTQPRVGMY